jgi:putative membrane-bound dehydrogenase-like protein
VVADYLMKGRPPMRSWLALAAAWIAALTVTVTTLADDETLIFMPPGFGRPGVSAMASGPTAGAVDITVIDAANGRPTPCRVNVVGPDGNFYQPQANPLSPYSLSGEWPRSGKGNRPGKGPFLYFGRSFYISGRIIVPAPAGEVRVEVWKGLAFTPARETATVRAGETTRVEIAIARPAAVSTFPYESGDSHLHFGRTSGADDEVIFDLLEAEDIQVGALLAYNEPAGPYHGIRERLDSPQLVGLGAKSERSRGRYGIVSGQEYRSRTYGHLNLFLRDDLVREGESYDADRWPPFGQVGRETRKKGGYAVYAHGGYAQAIYADFVRGDVDADELLQFGVYRGIGLEDWYRILNIGYRFPIVGSSDYPACRKLGDCLTYVRRDGDRPLGAAGWLRRAAEGRGFVTTAPLLEFDLDGNPPGALVAKTGPGSHAMQARVKVISAVAPVRVVQLIVNGRVVRSREVPEGQGKTDWFAWDEPLAIDRPSWVAVRAFGMTAGGSPDAEAHTNPVYVHVDDRAPYDRESLDALVAKLDGQIDRLRARDFPEKAGMLDHFQGARDILMRIREAGGLPSSGLPAAWLAEADRAGFDPSKRVHTDAELAEFLRPVPARTPAEALRTFESAGGFHLEPVAAEPLVRSPVAAAFDEDGNLYVCEMIDYPYKPRPGGTPLGSIRLLRDTDGDGRFDRADLFAEGLLWAAGVAPWKGGVFVTAPPDIWYLKDTDGDHKADLRRRVFTGFGTGNEQGMLNNLTFGLDHQIYGSTSMNGGSVRHAGRPDGPAVAIGGKDFRFSPVSEAIEPVTGTVQFGTTFDDWGDRFLCSESRPLLHAVLPLDAMARNPYLAVASGLENAAGNPVPIRRLSPPERWRQIRSSRRIAHGERPAGSAGASHHVADACAGVTIYRGSAYPADYYGNAFVCDAQNNLVHRMRLVPAGPTFRAEAADPTGEFVRSYDTWFRPVNLLNAPDGTLYVLDMSREIIEAVHVPIDVMKHLDLRRGRDQGRIYRVAPPGFRPMPPPRLGAATTAELVATLSHPDGWWRDTAHRLIYERQDPAAVAPLRDLLRRGPAVAKVHALWSLEGLAVLSDADTLAALADPEPRVVEQALKVAGRRLDRSDALRSVVLGLSGSDDARVRFAVALEAGAVRDPRAVDALAAIARRDAADRWARTAVLCSAADEAERLLERLAADPSFARSGPGSEMIEVLAEVVGARNRPEEVRSALSVASALAGPDRVLRGLGRGLARVGGRIDPKAPVVARWLREAEAAALEESNPEPARLEAIDRLALAPNDHTRDRLAGLLDPRNPGPVQVAALRAMAGDARPEVATVVLSRMRHLAPSARREAVATLLVRGSWAVALLEAVKSGAVDPTAIDPAQRAALVAHPNGEVARRARALFGASGAGPARDVVAAFAPALEKPGDATRGASVFDRYCATCHRLGARGHAVGPDLAATQFADPASLLTHILDPNRYVAPRDVQYIVSDKTGRIYTGLIASETAASLTLRRAEGAEDTILRSQVDELRSTGKSLMPEDFATRLTPSEAADLIAYLLKSRAGTAAGPIERLDIGTLPGLIEPEER